MGKGHFKRDWAMTSIARQATVLLMEGSLFGFGCKDSLFPKEESLAGSANPLPWLPLSCFSVPPPQSLQQT